MDPTIPDKFLTWLRSEMRERNLSQSEASRRAGLHQNAISEIVNGKVKEVSLKTCKALAKYFGVPTEEVLRLAGHLNSVGDDPSLRELLEIATMLTDEDRYELVELARFWSSWQHADKSGDKSLADSA